MEVVKANGVPIYELTCTECQSIIRYKASEVSACHITCPVCGVSNWATTCCPVEVRLPETQDCSGSRTMVWCDHCGKWVRYISDSLGVRCPNCYYDVTFPVLKSGVDE